MSILYKPVAQLCMLLTALSVFFIMTAAANLGNYRPVSGDETWIIIVSDKLAREGVLGNDMFRGFFGSEHHYFATLPLQYVMHAMVFFVSEPGITEARSLSVGATILTLWTVALLAFRWFGLRAALCTALLFILWRNNLTSQDSGMPLLGVGRSARYDVTPLAWMWLAVYAFDNLRRGPGILPATLLGTCLAAAGLTQFFGVFIGAGIALAWLFPGPDQEKIELRWALIAGIAFVAVISPYAIYVMRHSPDALAQFTHLHGWRSNFTELGSLPEHVFNEPLRYSAISSRVGIGNWLLLIGAVPVTVYMAFLAFGRRNYYARLVFFCLLGPLAGLAIIDTTKAPIYSIALLPSLALAFGVTVAHLLPSRFPGNWSQTVMLRAASALLLAAVLAEGITAYGIDRARGSDVTPYAEIGQSLHNAVPRDAIVAGPVRWAWPLKSHSYIAIYNLILQWQVRNAKGIATEFSDLINEYGVNYILIANSVDQMFARSSHALRTQFETFQSECTERVFAYNDDTYGLLEIHRVIRKEGHCG